MIRNQLNSLVHGEMSLGDAFVNEESITAVIVTARTGKFPLSVAHSFQSPAYQETRRIVEPTRKSSDDYPSSSPSHMVRPVFSSRTDAAELNDRPLKKRKHEHLESPSFVETASKVDDEEEEEEDGDSEDSYESSFVVDDDVIEHDNIKDHYLDLEAEEGSESQPSTESEGEGEDITVSDTEQRDRSNRPRSRRIVDDDDEEEDAPQPEAGKLKDRLQKLLQKQMDKDQARQPRSGVVDAAKEMPTPYDSVSQLSSEAIKEADKAKEVPVVDTPALPGIHFLDFVGSVLILMVS